MKSLLLSVGVACATLVAVQAADVTAKLTNVHLCCDNCVKGAAKAVGTVSGASVACDKDAGAVTLTGADKATVQKAADALIAAGYFGKSADNTVKITDKSGAKGKKVQTLKVSGVHLCCGKCVKAVDAVVTSVPGAKGHDAKKDAESFTVTGDFTDKDLTAALQKAGLTGKVE